MPGTSSSQTRTARCCCGDCSLTVKGEPVLNGLCHCASCRRRTGSAFGWSVYFADRDIVAREGVLNVYAKGGDNPFARFFCARCGTTLYWKSKNFMPDHTGIAGGCFADEMLPAPNLSASDNGRCAWLTLPEG